jgi:hypothetical protein
MDAGMVGADADVLSATGRGFLSSAEILRGHRAQVTSTFATAGWVGADADRSRADWIAVGAPALSQASRFVETLGHRLLEHADEQRRASRGAGATAVGVRAGVDHARTFVSWPAADLVEVLEDVAQNVVDVAQDLVDVAHDVVDAVDEVVNRWLEGERSWPARPSWPADSPTPTGEVTGLRPNEFGLPDDGRDGVLMAMQGLADDGRIARDEIEIRALDNGRYIVVLPGVTDLSDGVDQFVARVRRDGPFGAPQAGRDAIDAWVDNDEPTVRKMRYAYEAARNDDTTVNEYSVATVEALEAAGVPTGAEVMIVGHSFGAYTAMDLAADERVNAAHGGDPVGYHVDITHVIAAGAETDWRFDEIPSGTAALVLNNRFDGVYRAEDLLHGDGYARHDGHLEHNFWGGWEGYGHDEHNYLEWLGTTGDDGVGAWLDDVGELYTAGGTRVSVRVPDPNL